MDPIFKDIYPNLALIPDDVLDGIDLDDEFNAYQLHRLYDIIGLVVIKKYVVSQRKRFPGSLLFVGTLRYRYRHRLPRDFYDTQPKKWCLYLLITQDKAKAKIGISSNVQRRAFNLSKGNPAQTVPAAVQFDMAASLIISGFECRSDAQMAEARLKELTLHSLCLPPDWTSYFNAPTEWRTCTDDLRMAFSTIANADKNLTILPATDYHERTFTLLELLPLGERDGI